jgi:hypothetical protein
VNRTGATLVRGSNAVTHGSDHPATRQVAFASIQGLRERNTNWVVVKEGRLDKARRGELFNRAPFGHVRVPAGLTVDAEEQTRAGGASCYINLIAKIALPRCSAT